MAGQRAQTPIEIIGIAVILVALLLMVLVATYTRNMQTQQIEVTNERSIQCSRIAASIARLSSNRAVTKEMVDVFEEARIERQPGKSGSISIGELSCEYLGSVAKPGPPIDIYDTTEGGIVLFEGRWCFYKDDGIVNVSQNLGACA